jgi:hypothetical protein
VPAAQADEAVGQQFRGADANRDGRIDFAEFVAFYHGAGPSRGRLELRAALGPAGERAPALTAPCAAVQCQLLFLCQLLSCVEAPA